MKRLNRSIQIGRLEQLANMHGQWQDQGRTIVISCTVISTVAITRKKTGHGQRAKQQSGHWGMTLWYNSLGLQIAYWHTTRCTARGRDRLMAWGVSNEGEMRTKTNRNENRRRGHKEEDIIFFFSSNIMATTWIVSVWTNESSKHKCGGIWNRKLIFE